MSTTDHLHPATAVGRRLSYRQQTTVALLAAYTLSLAYSVYATVTRSHEGYSLTDPSLILVYVIGFGMAGLAYADRVWAWWTLAVLLAVNLAVSVFYYPTVFPPSAQNPVSWFENNVYIGLLMIAFYLCVQRLRGVSITAQRSVSME